MYVYTLSGVEVDYNGPFFADVTCMWKFDYYSVYHIPGGAANSAKCIMPYGESLTYACISACNSASEIAMCEVLTLFVEQREHFQLLFVASL